MNKKTKGVMIGKFVEELSMFDYKFQTTGSFFCVSFSLPYPKIKFGEPTAIFATKSNLKRHGFDVVNFTKFMNLKIVNAVRERKTKRSAVLKENRELNKELATANPAFTGSRKEGIGYVGHMDVQSKGKRQNRRKRVEYVGETSVFAGLRMTLEDCKKPEKPVFTEQNDFI